MQAISGLLFGICFAAVLGGIIRLLAPNGSSARLLRLFTALFVLATILQPVREIIRSFPSFSAQAHVQTASDAMLDTARKAIEQTAKNILLAHGFPDARITLRVGVPDGEIHAEIFRITGVPADQSQEISHEIFTQTGEKPVMETDP